jgi:pyruvate/2-oxoglutarate dehydrogenase complex dihydrolipoamide dehydrogenase (E3) component
LLIDKSEEHIGGDCLNYGCVPSKALIHIARKVHSARSVAEFGITANGDVDVARVMNYVQEKQSVIREHENADHFRKLGMTVELGEARFTGQHSVAVNGTEYTARNIVLATGSRPRTLTLTGLETATTYTNETVFTMQKLPRRFVFIGGGPISMELGQVFAFLGSKVTIVHSGERILEKEDAEVGTFMEQQLRAQGIEFVFSASPQKVEGDELVIATKDKGEVRVGFDALFIGIGRVLNIEGLDLEKAGIQLTEDKRKIIVNEYLQTTNPRIWTVGDVAGNYQFTHAAEEHAKVVINNMLNPFKKKFNAHMAWVTYTQPEIATFGRSHEELQKANVAHTVSTLSLSEDDRAIVDGAEGFIKVNIGTSGVILGGTLVAPNAGEIVAELILAENKKLTARDLFNRVAPYPTASRIIRKVMGQYEARRLKPWVQKLLTLLFRR